MTHKHQDMSKPLVRFDVLNQVLDSFESCGIDVESALESVQLDPSIRTAKNAVIHPATITRVLENCAAERGDKTLSAKAAASSSILDWPPYRDARRLDLSLGDFLNRFIVSSTRYTSATIFHLEVRGRVARLGSTRRFSPLVSPVQNDAYGVTSWITLLSESLGAVWNPSLVTIELADPSALLAEHSAVDFKQGNGIERSIVFPAKWLEVRLDDGDRRLSIAQSSEVYDQQFPNPMHLKDLIKSYVGDGRRLTFERLACSIGVSKRQVGKLLGNGDKLRMTIEEVQREYAISAIRKSDRSIADIAIELGYSESTAFSRTYKRWVGVSPQHDRNTHRYTRS